MSTEQRLIDLATAIGGDVKTLIAGRGDLRTLNTTAKDNLVAAINEILGLVGTGGGSGAVIDDTAGDGNTNATWSADKIGDSITAAINSLRDSLLNGAGPAFDTLSELANALGNDPNFATTLSADLANRVRYDAAQPLTAAQQLQACTNIGIGDPERDLLTEYTTARGAI